MRRGSRAVLVAVAAFAVAVPANAFARDRVVAVDGVAKHRSDLRVEILLVVPAGESARLAGNRALESQGAKRAPDVQSSGYTLNGLFWDRLPVVQNYNPAGEPTPDAATALGNTYGDWSSVGGSTYRITSGGTTSATLCVSTSALSNFLAIAIAFCMSPAGIRYFKRAGW